MQLRTVVSLAGLGAGMLAGTLTVPLGAQQRVPGVDVWIATTPAALDHGAPVAARAMSDTRAYLVVFRVTPDNRIVVLLPATPATPYQIPASGVRGTGIDASFSADSTNGVGYVFAVSSYTPFDFSTVRSGDAWDVSRVSARPTSNATTAATALADAFVRQIVPSRETAYGMNEVAYYVGVTPPSTTPAGTHTETTVTYVPSQYGRVVPDDGYDDYSGAYYWGYRYSGWGGNTWYPSDYWYSDDYWNNAYGFYSPYGGSVYSYTYYKVCGNGSIVPTYVACAVTPVPRTTMPKPRKPLPVPTRPVSPLAPGVPGTPVISPSRPVAGTPGLAPSTPQPVPPIVRPYGPGHRHPLHAPRLTQPTTPRVPPRAGAVATPNLPTAPVTVPAVTPPVRPAPPTPIHTVPVAPVRPVPVAPPPRPAPPPPPPPRHVSPPPPHHETIRVSPPPRIEPTRKDRTR